jgi:hypothetical protein
MRAVEADAIGPTVVDDVLVVNIVDNRAIYIRHSRVVKILVASPIPAIESSAGITKSIVNAAVEAHRQSPIAGVPYVKPVRKSPIARSPEQPRSRRENPNSGHPVVTVITVCPVTRFPDVTRTGTQRLDVHGKYRRGNADRDREVDCWTCSRGKWDR